jgi:hypothetical protein
VRGETGKCGLEEDDKKMIKNWCSGTRRPNAFLNSSCVGFFIRVVPPLLGIRLLETCGLNGFGVSCCCLCLHFCYQKLFGNKLVVMFMSI